MRSAWLGTTRILSAAIVAALVAAPARGQLLADSASVAGDSIARAFNAETDLCTYTDRTERSFASGDDHGDAFCESGGDGTFSHAERLECAKDGDIDVFSDAEDGANIVDFPAQASMIRARFSTAPGPHYVPVLLGHNDACSNETSRTGNSCSGDRDPNNYCRTTAAAFERDFRRGLDELIQVPDTRIAVLALIRISQLCNLRDKDACGPLFFFECDEVWQAGDVLEDIFGSGGICRSLTSDCSDQRRIDMYDTLVAYNEILARATAEYAALASGAASANGAVKAANVALRYIEAPFHYRLESDDLSCCDCFHPSDVGQRKLAQFTWDGLTCSEAAPCCAPSDEPLTNARCDALDSSASYPGGFWANGVVCGNRILDPGESCDDGNSSGGDGCSADCMPDGGLTPTPTPSGMVATPTRTAGAGCAGDCNADGRVTIDELILAVNISLGLQALTQCPAADRNADASVRIDELITAVNGSLLGCA